MKESEQDTITLLTEIARLIADVSQGRPTVSVAIEAFSGEGSEHARPVLVTISPYVEES